MRVGSAIAYIFPWGLDCITTQLQEKWNAVRAGEYFAFSDSAEYEGNL